MVFLFNRQINPICFYAQPKNSRSVIVLHFQPLPHGTANFVEQTPNTDSILLT